MKPHPIATKQHLHTSLVTPSCLLCEAAFVRVPAWFAVSAAIKVAEAKNVSAVLIEEPRKKVVARVQDLRSARPTELLARWVRNQEDAAAEAEARLPLAA